MSTQAEVNYTNDAQRRVALDTLSYQKTDTLTVPAGGPVALPSDLIRLLGVYQGTEPMQAATPDNLLSFISAGVTVQGQSIVGALGRQLYVIPYPSQPLDLRIIYAARPPLWESDQELVLSGPYESLVDQLVQATAQLDNGESGIAVNALAAYDTQARNLRRRAGARPGTTGRITPLRGRRRRL